MTHLRADARQALRSFRRQPGFTIAVMTTIALGIGASTAMFSVLNTVLLRPLPQANAERIVRLYQPNDASQTTGLSPLEIADVRQQADRVIEDIVEYHSMPFTFLGATEPQRLQTGVVSAGFFDVIGIAPILGRGFRPGEDQPGADPVLVLSHGYWQREFGGDPDVIGRTLRMNDRTHTVVGVLPQFPQYPDDNDVYMPSSSCPFRSGPGWAENRSARGLAVFAMLRDGVTHDMTVADLRTVMTRLKAEYPAAYRAGVTYDVSAVPLPELIARPARATVVMLLLATIMLLAIVCSNVGNLMIVRVLQRQSEMAVRLAFGATRSRLTRQLVTETSLLAAVGGAVGVVLAVAGTRVLASFVGRFTPRAAEISVDAPVLLFAIAAAAITSLVSGLLPLAAVRRDVSATLRQGGERTGSSGAHARIRNALIVTQVAVSLVLLAGAGLLLRNLVHMQRVDTGFDPEHVLTARLDLNWTRYDSPDRVYPVLRALEQSLAETPGVQAAGIGSNFPLNGDPANSVTFTAEGIDERETGAPSVAAMTASPGYFDALGVPLLRGRTFTLADENPDGEPTAIVTRSLAERYWPGDDAVGRRMSLDGGQNWIRIIGVVGDVRLGLDGDFDNLVFAPHNRFGGTGARVLVRSTLPRPALERILRNALAAIDPQQPLTDVLPLEAHRGERLSPYRIITLLMSAFALIALGVTALGLGAATAFSVAQRTREIGIRVAIGAQAPAILAMVLGQMLRHTAAGAALGLVATWMIVRFLDGRLAGVGAMSPLTAAAVLLVIFGVSAAAGMIPARRALRVDPLRAMRT